MIEPKIIWENIPKLVICFDSPFYHLHDFLSREYIRAGRSPTEATLLLEELCNGKSLRLIRDFGVECYCKNLPIILTGNLPMDCKQEYLEYFSADLLKRLENKIQYCIRCYD